MCQHKPELSYKPLYNQYKPELQQPVLVVLGWLLVVPQLYGGVAHGEVHYGTDENGTCFHK